MSKRPPRQLGHASGQRKGNRIGVSVTFDRPQLDRVNAYAMRSEMSFNAAVRALVDAGLKRQHHAQQQGR